MPKGEAAFAAVAGAEGAEDGAEDTVNGDPATASAFGVAAGAPGAVVTNGDVDGAAGLTLVPGPLPGLIAGPVALNGLPAVDGAAATVVGDAVIGFWLVPAKGEVIVVPVVAPEEAPTGATGGLEALDDAGAAADVTACAPAEEVDPSGEAASAVPGAANRNASTYTRWAFFG